MRGQHSSYTPRSHGKCESDVVHGAIRVSAAK